MGLPGSGKTTLSKKLVKLTKSVWLNADEIRTEFNDWDFSPEGRIRQANRMKKIAQSYVDKQKNIIADFICPTKKTRADFNPDYIVWMNTINEGRFDDTNKMFENPNSEEVDYIVTKKDAEMYSKNIYEKIKKKFNLKLLLKFNYA
mgnify:CR=1 FL=1